MEIEAKYSVPDSATFADLLVLDRLADYKFQAKSEKQVADQYLDTASRDILRGGYALRVREGESENRKITLKSLSGADGAVHQREEYEVEVVSNAPPVAWPESQARELALRLSDGQPLEELFVIHQHRSVREVKQGRRRVGLASLDVVEVEVGERTATFHELEIELSPTGTLEDLQALGELLTPYQLEPQTLSKFERALALREQPVEPKPPKKKKHPGVRADESMADAGRKILRFHFERMLANEEGTRAGADIEALHDMRVATRRQRAAFRIVAPYFKRKAIRAFQKELRVLAGHLGAVRDLDVLIEASQTYESSLSPETAGVFQPLLENWGQQRNLAREKLLTYLNGAGYQTFKENYNKFLSSTEAGVKKSAADVPPRPSLVRHILPAEIWSHYSKLRAYETMLDWATLDTLHALRIDGKRLRYLLEFFSEALNPAIAEAIEAIVALQDHVGELHDIDVAIGLLRNFLAHQIQTPAGAVGRYLKFKQVRLRALLRTLKRPWRKVTSKRFRHILAQAAAEL